MGWSSSDLDADPRAEKESDTELLPDLPLTIGILMRYYCHALFKNYEFIAALHFLYPNYGTSQGVLKARTRVCSNEVCSDSW